MDADVDVPPMDPPSITFAEVMPTIRYERVLIQSQDVSDVYELVIAWSEVQTERGTADELELVHYSVDADDDLLVVPNLLDLVCAGFFHNGTLGTSSGFLVTRWPFWRRGTGPNGVSRSPTQSSRTTSPSWGQ